MSFKTRSTASLVLATFLLGACVLQQPGDDAGNASFVRQIVPLMLGRPLRGAEEGQLLVDLIDLHDRGTVVRMLAREPGFRQHWTNVLVRQLELQRDGSRKQVAACFGDPAQIGTKGDGGALAEWVRDHDLDAPYPGTLGVIPWPEFEDALAISAWNFSDLIDSALELDDLSVIYKAYMVPLLTFDGNFDRDVGQFFVRTYLDRDLSCSECHNRNLSDSDLDYQRTWPMPTNFETPVLTCVDCSSASNQAVLFGIFRRDIVDGTGEFGDTLPWGIARECGTLIGTGDFQGEDPIPTQIAGIESDYESYPALIARFQSGVSAIQQQGVPASGSTPAPDRALAYMVAASASEKVWQSIMGSPLTVSHGYARNQDQMELHRQLTELLLATDWSLVDLIVQIVTSGSFNRDAPDHGAGTTPYRLPPIFDPFTVPPDDPGIPNEAPCPSWPDPQSAACSNGQGELITRFTPVELLTHVHQALGWTHPERFPASAYPSLELMTSMDSYLSDSLSGSRDWGFQSLIAWEDAAGRCEPPVDGDEDWIDLLMAAVAKHDFDHPDDPVLMRDVAIAVKDRLVQTTFIEAGHEPDELTGRGPGSHPVDPGDDDDRREPSDDLAPGEPDGPGGIDPVDAPITTGAPPETPETEAAGLRLLFEANLHTPVSAFISQLETRTRRYCGVLLRSPQKVIKGIAPRRAFEAPKLEVCVGPGALGDEHPGEPCGFDALCESYAATLDEMGQPVACGFGSVGEAQDLTVQIVPQTTG